MSVTLGCQFLQKALLESHCCFFHHRFVSGLSKKNVVTCIVSGMKQKPLSQGTFSNSSLNKEDLNEEKLPVHRVNKHASHIHHLLDSDWINNVIYELENHVALQSKKLTFIMSNPGTGQLIEKLLEAGVHNIKAYECNHKHVHQLKVLQDLYPDRCSIYKEFAYKVKDFEFEPYSWHDDCDVKLIGSLSTRATKLFLPGLVDNLAWRTGIFSIGRVEQYLFVSGMEEWLIRKGSKSLEENTRILHLDKTVPLRILLYPLFFEVDVLMQIPLICFHPNEIKNGWKNNTWDKDHMYLIKLTPQKDIFDVFESEEIVKFKDFLNQFYLNRFKRLIPTLESWCPGVGLWLINNGYDMLKKGKDLKLNDFIPLFKSIHKENNK